MIFEAFRNRAPIPEIAALQPGSDVLYVPAAYLADSKRHKPVDWLKDMLVRYGGETMREEEESC